MKYNNYSFNFREGKFCLTSKVEKEGYEKYNTQNPKTKEELVRYRKFVDEIKGDRISSIRIDTNYGSKLCVNMYNSETKTMEVVQVPFNSDRGYTAEARQMLNVIANYELGRPVSVRVTRKPYTYTGKDGEERSGYNTTFWFNYLDEKNENDRHPNVPFIKYDDIPKVVVEEKRGKKHYNVDDRDDFYYNILQDLEAKFAADKAKREEEYQKSKEENNTEAEPAKSKSKAKKAEPVLEPNKDFEDDFGDTEDDLPF